ncbi:septum formation inhibitor Maf [Bacillus luteolus]|uniref:dTTP/UTP pyrophosphatase n=1 Tax=Litchfieldia luteola TaxID=682179 RepID=A0ABR9QI33_9BACI|nr:Maf family protein [Cytobacillus luteolus]MBE4908145.1 septum formation inhibitor Maf [Cytobacillus luteolus]MBP1942930.1 septum formation protein [Cytobacillus luteolus]
MKRLILASGSPRRKELLNNLQTPFEISVSDIEEVVDPQLVPEQVVMSLAEQKARDVAKKYPNDFVLGADTIVVYDHQILGKPKDKQESYTMLKLLSGQVHEVLTGVAIIVGEDAVTFFERTEVEFWELTDEEIWKYINSGEPADKAGSYGIQELGSVLVKRISGDYFSVVGLPISRTIRELQKLGFKAN